MPLSRSTDSLYAQEMSFETPCIVYADKALLTNTISVKIGFLPTTDNRLINLIAIEKIEIFFNLLVFNSVVVSKHEHATFSGSIKLENNFFTTPEIPNDQIIGGLIFSKLVAILDTDLEIKYIKISSDLGKNIVYTIDEESPELLFLPGKKDWWESETIDILPWWDRSDTATYDLITDDQYYRGNIVWKDFFKEELEKLEEVEKTAKGKFKIISGGKDEIK